jgi:hypothetical protein
MGPVVNHTFDEWQMLDKEAPRSGKERRKKRTSESEKATCTHSIRVKKLTFSQNQPAISK